MLNQNTVLNYIKTNLAFPFQMIEFTDEKILEYISTYTAKEFSYYFPEVRTIGVNLTLPQNKVPGKANEFYIFDEQGLEILGIKNMYFSMSNWMFHGHPPLGPLSLGELQGWALATETAGWIKQFSNWDYTFEFKHPNIVRVSPTPNSEAWVAVEYERVQHPSFSGIPNDIQMFFLELCLADIMILLGRLRKKYGDGNIKTPFGDVPLNAEIGDEGREKKKEVLDKLTAGSLPSVILSFG